MMEVERRLRILTWSCRFNSFEHWSNKNAPVLVTELQTWVSNFEIW